MSKVFKRRRSIPIDPREWDKKPAPFTLFNDGGNDNNNSQQEMRYTSKLIRLDEYNRSSSNNDNDNDTTTATATTTISTTTNTNTATTSPLVYDLFGSSLKKQQTGQKSIKVKQFRRRPKVVIILNPNRNVEEQVRVPYGISKYLKPHQVYIYIDDKSPQCDICY